MSTPLTLYPVNTASSLLSTAGLLLSASGNTVTAAPTTLVGTNTGWGEIAFNGNAGPWAAAGAEPAPTGYGALFDASSSVLVAQMLLAGNWSGVLKLFNTGATTTLSYDHLKLRFWKWTSGTAISSATTIGSIDLGAQSTNNTATAFTFPNTSGSATNFAPSGNDYVYIDCVAHITSGTNTTTTTKIKMDIGGSSATQGNANFDIVSPGFQPTPVLAVASSTLNFSATAGGANPVSQGDALSETSGTGTAWTSNIVYGSGSGWLAISPTSDTLAAGGTNETVTFSCTTGALAAGTYSAVVTFTATTGGAQVAVTVTFTVNPSGTLVYSTSPYACTIYVSGQKTALDFERLQQFAAFTQGGTIPFTIRYQYSANYVITGGTPSNPTYGGWGPLDETVDKVNGIPGLRLLVNLAYFPTNWLAIDKTGKNVGYGGAGAVLPDGPAMAAFAAAISQRYGNKIDYQLGNEEYDTALNGPIGGTILAQTCNYAIPVIRQNAPKSLIIAGAIRPLSHPTGIGTQQWMTNFYTYTPAKGEPKQALPDAHDFHMYGDGSWVETTRYPSPDPTVTDNQNPLLATKPNVMGIVSIIQGVLNTYNPNAKIMNLENGFNLPNNSPLNHNNNPSDLPSQQSRYTRTIMAQLQNSGADAYGFYSLLGSASDPRDICGLTIADYTSYVAATPSWTGIPAPAQYLPTSVDALSFEGPTTKAPVSQYFSIGNPSTGNVAWSLSSNKSWLTAMTLPTNGMGGNQGGGLTNGTLAAGQWITLKCNADSTQNGLNQLTPLTGTLTITIGGIDYTITVSLFVTPVGANPSLTSGSAGPGNGPTFNMTVNGSAPANQVVSFTNADAYDTWWYAFTTCKWFSINTASGLLTAGNSQNITISIDGTLAPALAPGTYTEVVTISATPFPTTYSTSNTPAVTQFISVIVKLVVAKATVAAVQVSTPTLYYTAVASGSLPANQTFFFLNCRNAVQGTWSVAKTQTWLTLSPASGTNLPANGSNNNAPGGAQATDYQVITATVNTTGLSAGTYTDTITVTLGAATQTIAVTYVVTSAGSTQTIGATPSPNPFSLSQVAAGADVSGTVLLTNSGTQTGTYTNAITYTVGTGWIKSVSPGSNPLSGGGGTQTVTITLQTGNRAAGTYTATVTFKLGTSTAIVNITFTITSTATPATFTASPSALAFSAIVNGANPAGQILTITNTGGTNGSWSATIAYGNVGNNQGWLTLSPLSGALGAGVSQSVSAFADDTSLQVGTYTATISITTSTSGAAGTLGNVATVNVTFVVLPLAGVAGGALSNLLSLAVQKTQVVKVYDANGNYLGLWRDAPHLTGLRQTMNAADSPVKMVLPRKIDAFGGAGQPNTDNTVVMGNNVQVWLYGPGLPTTGLLKLNGIIDTIEPTIDASNAESVTVTITPYGSVMADHGYTGALTTPFTNVDPVALFTYWFNNSDPTPGLGGVTYANPLSLSSASAASSGLSVTYTVLNQSIKSVLDSMLLMLGPNWFWRVNPDTSALVSPLSPTAQHILTLGQHMASLAYSVDNNQRKNVIRFVGSTGVSATAVSTSGSALPPSQGGIGERLAFYQDSRITDNGSAQVMANGLLSILDRLLIRTKCRLVDYRGDTKTGLGYDIESINVGDTVSFRDARQVGFPTVYGNARYGLSRYGLSPGLAFNTVSPVLSIDYNWEYIDIEVGTFQPSLNKMIYNIRQRLQDFSMGQG